MTTAAVIDLRSNPASITLIETDAYPYGVGFGVDLVNLIHRDGQQQALDTLCVDNRIWRETFIDTPSIENVDPRNPDEYGTAAYFAHKVWTMPYLRVVKGYGVHHADEMVDTREFVAAALKVDWEYHIFKAAGTTRLRIYRIDSGTSDPKNMNRLSPCVLAKPLEDVSLDDMRAILFAANG